jgi:hypothetical protein
MKTGPVPEVEISKLSDLPYWVGNKEWVEEYYNEARARATHLAMSACSHLNQRRIIASPGKTTQWG